MSLIGFGQVDPGAVDPATGFTYGQEQALCQGSASSVWNPTTGTCNPSATPTPAPVTGPNLANPDAGTFMDVNCPWWCWVLGNGIDTAVSAACFPCGNICPSGTIWDTTNYVCSATPKTSNTSTPSTGPTTPSTTYLAYGAMALAAILAIVWVSKK
jgi:hypothetical protein